MGLFDNLIIKRLLSALTKLMKDPVALREYARKSLDLLDELADRTATNFDDLAVQGLKYAVDNDEAWNFCYDKIYALYDAIVNRGDDVLPSSADLDNIKAEAEDLGLDPVTIIALISMAVKVFLWWKERRGGEQ